MCRCCGEIIVDHLLLDCEYARTLLREVFLMFGIQWVVQEKVASLLSGLRNWLGKYFLDVWNMILAYLCGWFGGNKTTALLRML